MRPLYLTGCPTRLIYVRRNVSICNPDKRKSTVVPRRVDKERDEQRPFTDLSNSKSKV